MAFSTPVYPPGYRFVPTDVELVVYYLARQTAGLSSPSSPILEVQIYDYSPDDIFKNHNLSEDDTRYFFSSRMKRHNNGSRPDRSAGAGFWKATGAKIKIYDKNGRVIGSRTSLVYHKKQPSSTSPKKTNWLMTEYQIKQNGPQSAPLASDKGMLLDKWVLCKIYRGKRSSSEKSRKERKVPVVIKDQQELAYELEPASVPPAPVSQSDEMMQFFQEACSLLMNGEQPDPQPSHDEQINPTLDLDHMTITQVNKYFQESQPAASNETLMSQMDPQSSYGGHIKPIQDISDMRPNDMDFKPSTSDNYTKTNNLQQNVVKAPEAQHNQQFLQEPHDEFLAPPPFDDTPFCYFDSGLYYKEATKMDFFTEPPMTNELVYDFPIFDPEADFFAAHMTSFQTTESFTSSSSLT